MNRSSPAEQFEAAVAGFLQPHSAALAAVLGQLIRYPFVPEVRQLSFEVFCDSFTSAFPVRVYFLGDDGDEVFLSEGGEPRYPCDVDPDLLQVPGIYPAELEERFETLDPEMDLLTVAGEAVLAWFVRCWEHAGGESFSREASIGLHDDDRRFDLIRRTWAQV